MRTLIAFALIFLIPVVACADDMALAREHYDRALALVKLGKHKDAIKEFEQAFEASPRASLLYNIAHEHQVLAEAGAVEEMRQAAQFYDRYLEAQPNAPDREKVQRYLAELKARIAASDAAARDTAIQPNKESAVAGAQSASADEPKAGQALDPFGAGATAQREKAHSHKWVWLTAGIASVVVVGAAVGLGVGLSQRHEPPDTSLGSMGVQWQ